MQISINGQRYQGFLSATVRRAFTDLSGSFQFVATPKDISGDYPIQVGDSCQIVVEDEIFLTGYVETIDVDRWSSLTDFNIIISGRDTTADVVDSTISADIITQYTGEITVKSMCEQLLKNLGKDDIFIIDYINPSPFSAGELISPTTGQTAFSFLQQYAGLKQVILSTDGAANITINQTGTIQIPNPLLLEKGGKNNNILRMRSKMTQQNQFYSYYMYSQASLSTIEFQGTSFASGNEDLQKAVIFQDGKSINSLVRKGRRYTGVCNTQLIDSDSAQNYANWENNYRQTQGWQYQCMVVGHTYDGVNIWQPNMLIKLKDDYANVDAILLIDTVEFRESLEEGLVTILNLVWKNAYSLLITENYRDALANVRQKEFFSLSVNG
jgi:prophage tail gpP-like protein